MALGTLTERSAVAAVQLGEHLRTWRKFRRLNLLEVAERAGVCRATVTKVERGDGSVRLDVFLSVAQAVGCLDCIVLAVDPSEPAHGQIRAGEGLTPEAGD